MMKYSLLIFFLSTCIGLAQGQTINTVKALSAEKISEFKSAGIVSYSDFGAKGDGRTDDMEAIAAAHSFANQHSLKVKADDTATYYIGAYSDHSNRY